ncbi:hypothetical protein AK812_SmicGene18597 [Symbiodinium microadriaticum]|uniref:Uncharacterized protein n=1 Tax=Symbiodinium microadriaticum TaxID=2951 RepID=A0A1Q9DUV4_SYMMI|nr:hypothetical protein AK812_SmicGene18597 [Symbiodinium microadriaticum]CAE7892357.1 unnamed protein product [Symbiodinium microadriaticum]CAE7947552.1 unnamed protein product [Symbiodinium sp. KB8]
MEPDFASPEEDAGDQQVTFQDAELMNEARIVGPLDALDVGLKVDVGVFTVVDSLLGEDELPDPGADTFSFLDAAGNPLRSSRNSGLRVVDFEAAGCQGKVCAGQSCGVLAAFRTQTELPGPPLLDGAKLVESGVDAASAQAILDALGALLKLTAVLAELQPQKKARGVSRKIGEIVRCNPLACDRIGGVLPLEAVSLTLPLVFLEKDPVMSKEGDSFNVNLILTAVHRLKQKFLSLCILAPFMYADLRAGFSSELQTVDASSEKIAVVKAEVPSHVVKELSRHCLKKGRWARLLSPAQNWLREKGLVSEEEELPAGELLEEASTPLFEGLVPALRFETVQVSSCSQRDHINLSELKSIGAAERFTHEGSPDELESLFARRSFVNGRLLPWEFFLSAPRLVL